jgi:hypothetical protein
MTDPNAITFTGKIDALEEKTNRSLREQEMDDVPEKNIVYNDLVFTIAEGSKDFYRPGVIQYDEKLMVVTNPLSFRAAKEAGLTEILFDFIPTNPEIVAGEAWMERFGLEYAQKPAQRNLKLRFLFFNKQPKETQVTDLGIISHPNNSREEYKNRNCFQYILPVGQANVESDLMKRVYETNGPLRSIDGIKGLGPYKELFK